MIMCLYCGEGGNCVMLLEIVNPRSVMSASRNTLDCPPAIMIHITVYTRAERGEREGGIMMEMK